jgi:hypothetical protein
VAKPKDLHFTLRLWGQEYTVKDEIPTTEVTQGRLAVLRHADHEDAFNALTQQTEYVLLIYSFNQYIFTLKYLRIGEQLANR